MGAHANLIGRRQQQFFGFGSCVNEWALRECDESYIRLMSHQFNMITAECGMKWRAVRPQKDVFDWSEADAVVAFAVSNNQKVRGHCLLWHNPLSLPDWLKEEATWPTTKEDAESSLATHIKAVLEHFPLSQIPIWDVVNECLDDEQPDPSKPRLRKTPWSACDDWIEKAFHVAEDSTQSQQQSSGVRGQWYLNDYACHSTCGWAKSKSDAMYTLATRLRNDGVPLTGVGLQTHCVLGWKDEGEKFFEGIEENIRRYGEAGIQVQLTEVDVAGGRWDGGNFISKKACDWTDEDREHQADLYERLLQIALDAPNCSAYMCWGVSDNHTWLPEDAPLLYDRQYNPKPAVHRIASLLARSAGGGTVDFDDEALSQGEEDGGVHIEIEEISTTA